MSKRVPTFEVYKRRDGLFEWRLRASNGQVVATSGGQGYVSRYRAKQAALRIVATAADALVVQK